MFTLTQLRNFVAVAEELHFGRAAVRLRMTQPPLSRQIQLLEASLQVRLLDRTNRSVRLTPAGRSFLDDARRILRQTEAATLAVRQVSSGQAGRLTIGFTATSAHSVLNTVLDTARDVVPGVEIELREMVTRQQVAALKESALDIGLVRPPVTDTHLRQRPAAREDLIAALPAGHRLASLERALRVRDFDGEEVLMYSPVEARYFHELLAGIFRDADTTPVFTQHLGQVHSMIALVSAGWGIALVPASASRTRYAGVRFKELELEAPAPVELALAWSRSNDNPALQALLRHL